MQTPNGWYHVKNGFIRSSDQFLINGNYRDSWSAIAGLEVAAFTRVIREIKIPEGWFRPTEGMIKRGDKTWNCVTHVFQYSDEYHYDRAVSFVHCVIRKKLEIPDDWYQVQEGLILFGDQLYRPTSWVAAHASVGDDIKDSVVIRRKIPEGWFRVTEGKAKEGDKLRNKFCNDDFGTLADECVGNMIKSDEYFIRKMGKVPKGWMKVTEGLVQKHDQLWNMGVNSFKPALSSHRGSRISRYTYGVIRRQIPDGWELIQEGTIIRSGDTKLDGTHFDTYEIGQPHSAMTLRLKVLDGWFEITEGEINKGDRICRFSGWETVSDAIGQDLDYVRGQRIIRKKETEAPDGYDFVTVGLIEEGDMFFCADDWVTTNSVDQNLKDRICVYVRKISVPDIPDGWIKVTGFAVEAGDKFWFDNQWIKVMSAAGEPVSDFELVIRHRIPEGWYLVTDGEIQKGDKYGVQPGWWEPVQSLVSDDVSSTSHEIIRKIDEPGKLDFTIPGGWETITEGFIKQGDYRLSGNIWDRFCSPEGFGVEVYHAVIRRKK